jgi:two-component system NarL family sensor kinase
LTDALRRSRTEAVAALEDERRRLRRDLHDGLGPSLAGVAIGLETCSELITQAPDQATKLLSRLEQETKNALNSIRQLVYGLRPPALDDLGLIGAVQAQLAVLKRGPNGMRVALSANGDLGELPAAVEVAAYRIAIEGVTNAARHANADHCTLDICRTLDLRVEITDDGAGLPARWQPGVGIASMRERAAQLGGTLTITAPPEGGTSVTATLPIDGG